MILCRMWWPRRVRWSRSWAGSTSPRRQASTRPPSRSVSQPYPWPERASSSVAFPPFRFLSLAISAGVEVNMDTSQVQLLEGVRGEGLSELLDGDRASLMATEMGRFGLLAPGDALDTEVSSATFSWSL